MKAKFGTFFMLLGVLLVAASLGLLLYNQNEQMEAGASADAVMPDLVSAIQERQRSRLEGGEDVAPTELVPAVGYEEEIPEMTVVDINGYGYIGFVAIPELGLELPVMADWSYPQLRVSPCRYTGSVYTDDIVIMAHNYYTHFGQLKELKAGAEVIFTDMDGNKIYYEVIALDVLNPTAVGDMTAGEYDLTLFTCTYGGQSRVTVRCDRISE